MDNETVKCGDHSQARNVATLKGGYGIWAGKQAAYAPAGAIRINLTGKEEHPVFRFQGIQPPKVLTGSQITIDWPDMGVPGVNRIQWDAVVNLIRQVKRPVYVGCGAGHGRTGTALSILCSLLGLIPKAQDPVLWVRERYCPQAVESTSQCQYISSITGRVVTAKPSGGSGILPMRYCKGNKNTCPKAALPGSDFCEHHGRKKRDEWGRMVSHGQASTPKPAVKSTKYCQHRTQDKGLLCPREAQGITGHCFEHDPARKENHVHIDTGTGLGSGLTSV